VWYLAGTEEVQEITLGVYDHPPDPAWYWIKATPVENTRAARAAAWITSRATEINTLRKYLP
jgi:hypothetical protein